MGSNMLSQQLQDSSVRWYACCSSSFLWLKANAFCSSGYIIKFLYLGSIMYVEMTYNKTSFYHNVAFSRIALFLTKASGSGTRSGFLWYQVVDCCHHSETLTGSIFLLQAKAIFKVCWGTAEQWPKTMSCTPMLNLQNTKEEISVSQPVICIFLWVSFNTVWMYHLNMSWWWRGDVLTDWQHILWRKDQPTLG